MKKTMKLASRGKRFAAGMIDLAFPFVAYMIVTSVMGIRSVFSNDPYGGYGNSFGYGYGYGYGYNYNYNYNNLSGGSAALIGILCILLIAFMVAEIFFYSKAMSIGKAMLGLQVVSSADGKPFGFWKMMLRECIVKNASGSVLALGYIWILIDERNRSWHDKILDSYVVDLRETERMYARTKAPADEVNFGQSESAGTPKAEAAPYQASAKLEAPAPAPAKIEAPAPAGASTEAPAAQSPAAPSASDDKAAATAAALSESEAPRASMAMKRDELIELADKLGVELSSGATKPEIIEAINKTAGGNKQPD